MSKPRSRPLAEATQDTIARRDPLHPFNSLPFVTDHGRWQDWWVLPEEAPDFSEALTTGEAWAQAFIRRTRMSPSPAGMPLYAIVCAMATTGTLLPRPITRDRRHAYAVGFFNELAGALGEVRHG